MAAPKFWIKISDEENIELYVGKRSVGAFNHDEHGWREMRDAETLFENVAKVLDAKFEKRYLP